MVSTAVYHLTDVLGHDVHHNHTIGLPHGFDQLMRVAWDFNVV